MSEEAETISLHDHLISSVEELGPDLELRFTRDGFDVTKDNPLNPTGRNRNTGPAAVLLKGWRFLEGAFNRDVEVHCPDGTRYWLPEEPLTKDLLLCGAFQVEVLDFGWDSGTGEFHIDGDGGIWHNDPDTPDGPEGFVTLRLRAGRALFCWNDLPQDAWFQDWPRK